MKYRLSFIFDFAFGTFFVFGVCFVWARYFIHNITASLVVCGVATFCIVGLYWLIFSKRQNKKARSKNDLKMAQNISKYFLLCTKQEVAKEFCKLLSKTAETKIKSDYLITNKVAIRPLYNTTQITDKDVLESFAKIKNSSLQKLIICCQSCTEKARDVAGIIKTKQVQILTEYDAYKQVFEPAGFVVELPKDKPLKFKEKLKKQSFVAFNKKRTKSYLLVAITMLFGSFVLRYNVYYLIFATISTLLALYSHFNTKFNTKDDAKIF